MAARVIKGLCKGDKIAIAATARKVDVNEVTNAANMLRSWGFEPVFSPGLFEEHNQFAGSDQRRAASLQAMLDDPEIKAILCARGGYGTVRIIDLLNFDLFLTEPKWIAGYSDIT